MAEQTVKDVYYPKKFFKDNKVENKRYIQQLHSKFGKKFVLNSEKNQ